MSQPRKILFPTKFEELSFLVVQHLMQLKRSGLEEFVFLFVIDRDEVAYDLLRGFDEKYAGELTDRASARFEDWEKQLADVGMNARHRVEIGDPATEILKVAREERVDLVVAGRQRVTPMEKVYLGGTSMALLRNSDIPVMICKPYVDDPDSDDRSGNPFERIVLATDFSSAAQRATEFVKGIRGAVSEVRVVHVLNERDLSGHPEQEAERMREEAQSSLDAVVQELGAEGWDVDTHLRSGRTAREILRVRDDHDGTMIVMGTTGKHGIQELWLGSASHRCVEMSAVPVILVPEARV